jgi:hypothetical protein
MTPKNLYEKLTVYQAALDHEQGIRSNFQNLLIAIQGIFFGVFITLSQLELREQNWVLAFISILTCVILGVAAEYRARNVDIWRKNIVRLIKGTELEEVFYEGKYRWYLFKPSFIQVITQYLFGHWFERIITSAIISGWAIVLYFSFCPRMFQVISGIAILFWFVYTFRILDLKGAKMPDRLI